MSILSKYTENSNQTTSVDGDEIEIGYELVDLLDNVEKTKQISTDLNILYIGYETVSKLNTGFESNLIMLGIDPDTIRLGYEGKDNILSKTITAIKTGIKKLWDFIVGMVEKVVNWFKKVFKKIFGKDSEGLEKVKEENKRKIEELEAIIKKKDQELRELNINLEGLKNRINNYKEIINNLESHNAELQERINNAREDEKILSEENKKLSQELQKTKKKLENLVASLNAANREKDSYKKDLEFYIELLEKFIDISGKKALTIRSRLNNFLDENKLAKYCMLNGVSPVIILDFISRVRMLYKYLLMLLAGKEADSKLIAMASRLPAIEDVENSIAPICFKDTYFTGINTEVIDEIIKLVENKNLEDIMKDTVLKNELQIKLEKVISDFPYSNFDVIGKTTSNTKLLLNEFGNLYDFLINIKKHKLLDPYIKTLEKDTRSIKNIVDSALNGEALSDMQLTLIRKVSNDYNKIVNCFNNNLNSITKIINEVNKLVLEEKILGENTDFILKNISSLGHLLDRI